MGKVVDVILQIRRGDLGPDLQELLKQRLTENSKKVKPGLEVEIVEGDCVKRNGVIARKPKASKGKAKFVDPVWNRVDPLTEEVVSVDEKLVVVPRKSLVVANGVNSQTFRSRLEAVTSLDWESGKDEKDEPWVGVARRINTSGKRPFLYRDFLPESTCIFRRKVYEKAWAYTSSFDRACSQWIADHKQFCKDKADFEAKHPEYMRVLPLLQEFDNLCGSGRPNHTHGWLKKIEFFSKPQVVTWRDSSTVLTPLPLEGLNVKSRKLQKAKTRLFWSNNPELAALNKLHDTYREDYTRPWAKRKNEDGFKLKPSFSMPGTGRATQRYVFQRNDTYKDLNLNNRTVKLKTVLDKAAEEKEWITIHFETHDKRFEALRQAESGEYFYYDPFLKAERTVDVKGLQMSIRGLSVYFSLMIDFDAKKTSGLMVKDKDGKLSLKIPEDYIVLSADIGDRKPLSIVATRFVRNAQNPNGVVELVKIKPAVDLPLQTRAEAIYVGDNSDLVKDHEYAVRPKFRNGQRSRPRKQLSDHVQNLREDMRKKTASKLVEAAVATSLHYKLKVAIVLENLESLKSKLSNSRQRNRQRSRMAICSLVQFIESLAEVYSIPVKTIRPIWTSQICPFCGSAGARAEEPSKSVWKRFYEKQYGSIRRMIQVDKGPLFICGRCHRMGNADGFASINIGKVAWKQFLLRDAQNQLRPIDSFAKNEIASLFQEARKNVANYLLNRSPLAGATDDFTAIAV